MGKRVGDRRRMREIGNWNIVLKFYFVCWYYCNLVSFSSIPSLKKRSIIQICPSFLSAIWPIFNIFNQRHQETQLLLTPHYPHQLFSKSIHILIQSHISIFSILNSYLLIFINLSALHQSSIQIISYIFALKGDNEIPNHNIYTNKAWPNWIRPTKTSRLRTTSRKFLHGTLLKNLNCRSIRMIKMIMNKLLNCWLRF